MDQALYQSYDDSELEYTNIDISKLVNCSSYSSIKHDHRYCLNSDAKIVTPKRRRLSSISLVWVLKN